MRVIKRGAGTKTQPTQVPSVSEKRIIGCICMKNIFIYLGCVCVFSCPTTDTFISH